MRGVMLQDLQWEAKIEYKNHPDSKLVFSAVDAPDILTALARVHNHVKQNWPYEIISLRQIKDKI